MNPNLLDDLESTLFCELAPFVFGVVVRNHKVAILLGETYGLGILFWQSGFPYARREHQSKLLHRDGFFNLRWKHIACSLSKSQNFAICLSTLEGTASAASIRVLASQRDDNPRSRKSPLSTHDEYSMAAER